ncbi:hypothetical protein L7F22_001002 [Adiantum nelumboides]|nr:hypothetical protein [Adiantum nelumboides]
MNLKGTGVQPSMQRSDTEGGFHLGKRKVDEQVVKASTSATLPWELFVEPVGASKKVREQFVEVYNRARDELKNQRLSQSTNRELDGGPKLTLGPTGASSNVRVEWQSYNQGGELSGPMQSQGKNTMLEHQIRPMNRGPTLDATVRHRGGFHLGKRKVDEQVVKASTSATLPWELFVEPAGASKKVREQFVEVYNRARDELKNQRLSQSTNRELDGVPKLTLGPTGASSNVRVEWQSYNQGGELSGPMQSQGKNTMLEHQIRPSRLKEPTVMTAADSSQCKQVEGFRRVHSVLKVPLRLSHKTAVGEGNVEVSSQRTGEGSVIHGKESKGPDIVCPSNPVSVRKNSVLKLGKDVKSAGLHQISRDQKELNGQEAVPVLGKRSRVTFEDQTMSLGAEKGAASRPRPQSKPHLWLQRWHSTSKHNSNGLSADTQVTPDGKRNDVCSYRTLGLKRFNDEDGMGVFGQGVNSIDRVKFLKTNSSKVLPSAAAMAIVGTAARQFCSSHPQGKGSFAFWSGFGMPSYGKVEPVLENGKGQVFVKANENLLSS